MAKKRASRRGSALQPMTPEHSAGPGYTPEPAPLPAPVAAQLGPVLAFGTLAGVLNGPAARIYLPLDSMAAHGVARGDLLLVGVADRMQPPPPALSPLGFEIAGGSPSPMRTKGSDAEELVLLPVLRTLDSRIIRKDSSPEDSTIGDYVALVEVHAAVQLQRDTFALSLDVAAALGRPDRGATLLLHHSRRIGLPVRRPDNKQPQLQPPVHVRICTNEAGSAPLLGRRGAPVLNSSPSSEEQPESSEFLGASPARITYPPMAQSAPALTTSIAASRDVGAATPDTGGRTPAKGSPAKSSPSKANPAVCSEMLAALLNPQQRHNRMIGELAARALAGSRPLPGNLVLAPLAGTAVALQVTSGSGDVLGPSVQVLLDQAAGAEMCCTPLSFATDDPAVNNAASKSAAADVLFRELEVAVAQATASHRRRVTAAAGAAAAAAVGGGTSGAAAVAAGRAAALGAAASSRGYSSLGGISEQKEELRKLVTLPLQAPELFAQYGISAPRGVLLHGPPGCGKTVLAAAAAAEAGATLFLLNGSDVVSEAVGESEQGLRGVFAAARAAAPSVIFLDEADSVAPARTGGDSAGGPAADASAARLVSCLLTEMDGGHAFASAADSTDAPSPADNTRRSTRERQARKGTEGDRVVVIAATNRPEAMDGALRRPGRFDTELEIGVPTPSQRAEILRSHLASVSHSLSAEEVQDLATAAHAFVAADLAALVADAAMTALRRCIALVQQMATKDGSETVKSLTLAMGSASIEDTVSTAAAVSESRTPSFSGVAPAAVPLQGSLKVSAEDFASARARARPSALREVAVELPDTRWSDVGGLHGVKERLKEAVEWPQKYPERLAAYGAKHPGGVLLYGPPGCSKTLLGRAVAGEAGLNFLTIKSPDLFSKYVGESEKAIVTLFNRARRAAPSVIFLDELDGLAPPRGETGNSLETRVMATLLQEMDGMHERTGVTVLAATNRPDMVDPALLRPGRFDRLELVGPPDVEGRAAILAVHTRTTPLAADVDLHALAARAIHFTGADLTALVREAGLAALMESFDTKTIARRHFEAAFGVVHATGLVTEDMWLVYNRFRGRACPPV
mmetsp:Transcript_9348/g.28123  ORF Transcript_9348/g.28123 Transcript_9348/m.28123 type:complete len:1086 (-) Transcript_9348:370-3627(-)|eukprot:CAMPEP_0206138212 /NCGR_PEP_ID=MMETSP1473-20131121/3156_1 /ASSEMBLY_ACC=CAM_ASM_001109 /TAXON_ID=1461547 /ORGANISM="Stichococcus sp, Strain RCC1054" /LENGTH=1085 /DNA_ID=CAMNT_0053531569 /DNA_START=111 /DNA_END=3368 /DNA_ORIENTATION=+